MKVLDNKKMETTVCEMLLLPSFFCYFLDSRTNFFGDIPILLVKVRMKCG